MDHVYLKRIDPALNMNRFYHLFITPGLFDDVIVVTEWGRRGSPGTMRKKNYNNQEEAEQYVKRVEKTKRKKGYF